MRFLIPFFVFACQPQTSETSETSETQDDRPIPSEPPEGTTSTIVTLTSAENTHQALLIDTTGEDVVIEASDDTGSIRLVHENDAAYLEGLGRTVLYAFPEATDISTLDQLDLGEATSRLYLQGEPTDDGLVGTEFIGINHFGGQDFGLRVLEIEHDETTTTLSVEVLAQTMSWVP